MAKSEDSKMATTHNLQTQLPSDNSHALRGALRCSRLRNTRAHALRRFSSQSQ
jgi:hypothetical protein